MRRALFAVALALVWSCSRPASTPPPASEPPIDPMQRPPAPSASPPPGPIVDTRSPPEDLGSRKTEKGPCEAELEGYCKGKCASFDETWKNTRAHVAERPCSQGRGAEMGSCGDVRFVNFNGGFSGWTQYFDGRGKLVGLTEWSDYDAYCNNSSMDLNRGNVPKCTHKMLMKAPCGKPTMGGSDGL